VISLLKRLLSPKKIRHPRLCRPAYVGRHLGSTFLILGSGPTIRAHTGAITDFVDFRRPVILSANIPHPLWLDSVQYVGFTNRKRLSQAKMFSSMAGACCLIGPHIRARDVWVANWERMPYRAEEREFSITDGIIQCDCGDCGTTLIAVAFIMGASGIFVAGMDGYKPDGEAHCYDQPDWSLAGALAHQRRVQEVLPQMRRLFAASGVTGPTWITPSIYTEGVHARVPV